MPWLSNNEEAAADALLRNIATTYALPDANGELRSLSEEGIKQLRYNFRNVYIAMESEPVTPPTFLGRVARNMGKATRAFFAPYVTLGARTEGWGIFVLMIAALAFPPVMFVMVGIGLYNIYDTFKNKADYHLLPILAPTRTQYNQLLSKAIANGKDDRLNADKTGLSPVFVEKENKTLAISLIANYIDNLKEKQKNVKQVPESDLNKYTKTYAANTIAGAAKTIDNSDSDYDSEDEEDHLSKLVNKTASKVSHSAPPPTMATVGAPSTKRPLITPTNNNNETKQPGSTHNNNDKNSNTPSTS